MTKRMVEDMLFDDPTHYYIILMEGNQFPSWFNFHRNGLLMVPLNLRVPGTPIYSFINPNTKKGKLVGKDEQFKYYLDEVFFTTTEFRGKFSVRLNFTIEIRPSFTSKYPPGTNFVFMKEIKPTYEIYPPIFQ